MQLVAEDLSYSHDSIDALAGVGLGFARGEFVGIVGRTGSGKTTLLQLLAGLRKPAGGRVLLEGDDINAPGYERSMLRRKLGILFQNPQAQLFGRTVAEDVAFGPAQLGLDAAERDERVRWALSCVGLEADEVGELSPLGLSGGQRRRVAIAGVLAARPELLLLDEPVAGLDPAGRMGFMELLERLNAQGVTILMVSHNADMLVEHARRIVVLDAGRVVRDGVPSEVYGEQEYLRELGVGVGSARELAACLEETGMLLREGVVTHEELLAELKRLLAPGRGARAQGQGGSREGRQP